MVIRRDWQLQAMTEAYKKDASEKGRQSTVPDCAAELLSVFEFHHNNRWANAILRGMRDTARGQLQRASVSRIGDWLPYTYRELYELLLGTRYREVIQKALDLLAASGFVSRDAPADLVEITPHGIHWFRLETNTINAWIDANSPKSWVRSDKAAGYQVPEERELEESPEEEPEEQPQPEAPDPDGKVSVHKLANLVFEFYKHVHGKKGSFVFDSKRRGNVERRIKERIGSLKKPKTAEVLGASAQAIIGNLHSDYHQGRSEDKPGQIFDDIELIFRTAAHFERHIQYAERAGVTFDKALRDFHAVINGQSLPYAKGAKKTPHAASMGQTEAIQAPPDAHRYKEFARAIASFFVNDLPASQVVDYVLASEKLRGSGKGLTEERYLIATILEAVKVFRPSGVTNPQGLEISRFAKTFCRTQMLNKQEE